MAFWKIVGFDVTPRMPSSTSRCSCPLFKYPRLRLSSQGLWPCCLHRSCSFVMLGPYPASAVFEERHRGGEAVEEVASAYRPELTCGEESRHRHGPEHVGDHGGVVVLDREQVGAPAVAGEEQDAVGGSA